MENARRNRLSHVPEVHPLFQVKVLGAGLFLRFLSQIVCLPLFQVVRLAS